MLEEFHKISHFNSFPSFADVKILAEKEDWVVDNEGFTSLVGTLLHFQACAIYGVVTVN